MTLGPAPSPAPLRVREGSVLDLGDAAIDLSRLGTFDVALSDGALRLRAGWGVGIQRVPLRVERPAAAPLVLVFPKGAKDEEAWTALARFSQLVALADGAEAAPEPAWSPQNMPDAERFLLVFAEPLLAATTTILLRHQRRHYRTEEEELVGRVRGRPIVAAHARRVLAGAAYRIPCRYEEFDFDNADNRVLRAALRRLGRVAAALAPGGRLARRLHTQADRFEDVTEVHDPRRELARVRFHRVSAPYRTALGWARAVLRGVGAPGASVDVGELWLDAAEVFERFVERVAQRALPEARVDPQDAGRGVFREQAGTRPDLVARNARGDAVAIGDAKYKDVCRALAIVEDADFAASHRVRMAAADTYQLYAYLRLRECATGFFVVPYWARDGRPADHIALDFERSPLDPGREARAFVLGLNLAAPPLEALGAGAALLRAAIGGQP